MRQENTPPQSVRGQSDAPPHSHIPRYEHRNPAVMGDYGPTSSPQVQNIPPPHSSAHMIHGSGISGSTNDSSGMLDPSTRGLPASSSVPATAADPNSSAPTTGASGKRPINTSKRAAQNRAAQKAFRQRREHYIKTLEYKAEQCDRSQTIIKQYHQRLLVLEHENKHMRRLLGLNTDLPPDRVTSDIVSLTPNYPPQVIGAPPDINSNHPSVSASPVYTVPRPPPPPVVAVPSPGGPLKPHAAPGQPPPPPPSGHRNSATSWETYRQPHADHQPPGYHRRDLSPNKRQRPDSPIYAVSGRSGTATESNNRSSLSGHTGYHHYVNTPQPPPHSQPQQQQPRGRAPSSQYASTSSSAPGYHYSSISNPSISHSRGLSDVGAPPGPRDIQNPSLTRKYEEPGWSTAGQRYPPEPVPQDYGHAPGFSKPPGTRDNSSAVIEGQRQQSPVRQLAPPPSHPSHSLSSQPAITEGSRVLPPISRLQIPSGRPSSTGGGIDAPEFTRTTSQIVDRYEASSDDGKEVAGSRINTRRPWE
ncbi:hypothetical protein H4219_003052 [Mycoemilia scoparia]|uniref:BZIP domain-containing protein n=1 Tax=Mycoemilia scoparia TaxID=417184 RepID=A0A9W7ZWN0_9FUNG|nr:hypothetical protein H4219_003052 [Mycoemilia scoparia]